MGTNAFKRHVSFLNSSIKMESAKTVRDFLIETTTIVLNAYQILMSARLLKNLTFLDTVINVRHTLIEAQMIMLLVLQINVATLKNLRSTGHAPPVLITFMCQILELIAFKISAMKFSFLILMVNALNVLIIAIKTSQIKPNVYRTLNLVNTLKN